MPPHPGGWDGRGVVDFVFADPEVQIPGTRRHDPYWYQGDGVTNAETPPPGSGGVRAIWPLRAATPA